MTIRLLYKYWTYYAAHVSGVYYEWDVLHMHWKTCTGKHALENMHCEGPTEQLVKAIQTHVSQPTIIITV